MLGTNSSDTNSLLSLVNCMAFPGVEGSAAFLSTSLPPANEESSIKILLTYIHSDHPRLLNVPMI